MKTISTCAEHREDGIWMYRKLSGYALISPVDSSECDWCTGEKDKFEKILVGC